MAAQRRQSGRPRPMSCGLRGRHGQQQRTWAEVPGRAGAERRGKQGLGGGRGASASAANPRGRPRRRPACSGAAGRLQPPSRNPGLEEKRERGTQPGLPGTGGRLPGEGRRAGGQLGRGLRSNSPCVGPGTDAFSRRNEPAGRGNREPGSSAPRRPVMGGPRECVRWADRRVLARGAPH